MGGSLGLCWEWLPGPELWDPPRDMWQVPVPGPSAQFRFLMWWMPSLSLQQHQGQEQHSPSKWEETGGSTMTDAVQNLHLRVI